MGITYGTCGQAHGFGTIEHIGNIVQEGFGGCSQCVLHVFYSLKLTRDWEHHEILSGTLLEISGRTKPLKPKEFPSLLKSGQFAMGMTSFHATTLRERERERERERTSRSSTRHPRKLSFFLLLRCSMVWESIIWAPY